jgi:hypothetical protein
VCKLQRNRCLSWAKKGTLKLQRKGLSMGRAR